MNLKAEFKLKTWFTSFMLNETQSAPIANVRRGFCFTYVSPPVTPVAEWYFFVVFPLSAMREVLAAICLLGDTKQHTRTQKTTTESRGFSRWSVEARLPMSSATCRTSRVISTCGSSRDSWMNVLHVLGTCLWRFSLDQHLHPGDKSCLGTNVAPQPVC